MRKRTKSREFALQVLFQVDITKEDINKALQVFWQYNSGPVSEDVKSFSEILIKGCISNLEGIDTIIAETAANWVISRMAVIDRNILRIAAFEMIHIKDIPIKVSINEAVELAKKFGDIDSGKFVNGILDKISKSGHIKKDA